MPKITEGDLIKREEKKTMFNFTQEKVWPDVFLLNRVISPYPNVQGKISHNPSASDIRLACLLLFGVVYSFGKPCN